MLKDLFKSTNEVEGYNVRELILGGSKILIRYPDSFDLNNVLDNLLFTDIKLWSKRRFLNYEITFLNIKNRDQIINNLQHDITVDEPFFHEGHYVYFSSLGFINIIKVGEDSKRLINISSDIEIAVNVVLRKLLMEIYKEIFYQITVLHGNILYDRYTSSSIAICGPSRSGKTTLSLALMNHDPERYSFVANDDITLGFDESGNLKYLPLPADIAVRLDTLDLLNRQNVLKNRAVNTCNDSYQLIYPKQLESMGFHVNLQSPTPVLWIFLDNGESLGDNKVALIEDQLAVGSLENAVRKRRQIHFQSDLIYGESIPAIDNQPEPKMQHILDIYGSLKKNNARFFIVKSMQDISTIIKLIQGL